MEERALIIMMIINIYLYKEHNNSIRVFDWGISVSNIDANWRAWITQWAKGAAAQSPQSRGVPKAKTKKSAPFLSLVSPCKIFEHNNYEWT